MLFSSHYVTAVPPLTTMLSNIPVPLFCETKLNNRGHRNMIKIAVQIHFTTTLSKFSQLFFRNTSHFSHLIQVCMLHKLYLHFFKGVANNRSLYLRSSAVPNCVVFVA